MSNWWNDRNVRTKLLAGFGCTIVVFLVAMLAMLQLNSRSRAENDLAFKQLFPARQAVLETQRALRGLDDDDAQFLLDENPKTAEATYRLYHADIEELKKAVVQAESLAQDDVEREAIARYHSAADGEHGLLAVDDAAAELKRHGRVREAAAMFVSAPSAPVASALDAYASDIVGLVAASRARSAGFDSAATIVGIIAPIVSIVLAIIVALALTRSITIPLARALHVVTRISAGDFGETVVASSQDEIGLLVRSIGRMAETIGAISGEVVSLVAAANRGDLRTRGDESRYENGFRTMVEGINSLMGSFESVVGRIRAAADLVGVASREIATGNTDLSQRTSEQASSLEETASSMEELTSNVGRNVDSARQANQLTMSAADIAVRGGAVVSQVVETMANIDRSSRKIVDIIGVIDGIAFQVNILALNAAVEAARAGEEGRGFAVVASEVRSLAQRTATAAKEIKALITDSVEKTSAGNVLAGDAGSTMAELVTSIKRVADIMSEISAASIEQGSGIEQVNQAVLQMDEVTQQNAALVEEAAAAAASLEAQADDLVALVSRYSVSTVAVSAADRPAPRPHAAETRAPERRRPTASQPVRGSRADANGRKSLAPAVGASANGHGGDSWESF